MHGQHFEVRKRCLRLGGQMWVRGEHLVAEGIPRWRILRHIRRGHLVLVAPPNFLRLGCGVP